MNANDLLSPDIEVVSTCLKDGVDPNAFVGRDADDVRALAVHCFSGHVDIVRLLLENGADPNLGRESTGETPLHHAVLMLSQDVVLIPEPGAVQLRSVNGVCHLQRIQHFAS